MSFTATLGISPYIAVNNQWRYIKMWFYCNVYLDELQNYQVFLFLLSYGTILWFHRKEDNK